MNFLCLCRCGHSRSVACTRVLHARGHKAMAMGVETADENIINLAAGWADFIVVTRPHYADAVWPGYQSKVILFDLGPDVWSNPYHPDLARRVEDFCNAKGWY